ncbi:hypothetical protein EPO15_04950 [bacterium]|nr:MAG: hypothetical protein EPO15_04950 [bacterium]
MSRAACLWLLAAGLGCSRLKGSPLVPVAGPSARFAVFAGVPSDDEPILVQRAQEAAQEDLLREMTTLLRERAAARFIENTEVKRLYGKNFLPIPAPFEKRQRFDATDRAQWDDCNPLTAAHVRGRLGVDVFAVVWVLTSAPPAEPEAPPEATQSKFPPLRGPYLLQLYSAADCRTLAFWETSLPPAKDLMARASHALPRAAAERLVDVLRGPLGL